MAKTIAAGADEMHRRIDDIADAILAACEGPRGELKPWSTPGVFNVAERCYNAAQGAPEHRLARVATIIAAAVGARVIHPWSELNAETVALQLCEIALREKRGPQPADYAKKRERELADDVQWFKHMAVVGVAYEAAVIRFARRRSIKMESALARMAKVERAAGLELRRRGFDEYKEELTMV